MDNIFHPPRAWLALGVSVLLVAGTGPVRAAIYHWIDDDGVETYSNTPPPDRDYTEIRRPAGASDAPTKPARETAPAGDHGNTPQSIRDFLDRRQQDANRQQADNAPEPSATPPPAPSAKGTVESESKSVIVKHRDRNPSSINRLPDRIKAYRALKTPKGREALKIQKQARKERLNSVKNKAVPKPLSKQKADMLPDTD